MNQYFFKIPFANGGDRTTISQPVDLTGLVSFTQGWGPDYALDPATNPSAQDVDRGTMNWLMNALTLGVQQYQVFGAPEFIAAADNGGVAFSYAKNATVRYQPTPSDPWHVYVSKIDSNTSLPTVSASWIRDDEWLTASQIASAYLSLTAAATTYLTQSSAAGTYETQTHAAATYLTQGSAAATYLTQGSASANYATIGALNGVNNTAVNAQNTANAANNNFANYVPNMQGSNSGQRGYMFGWYTGGAVTLPAGGTYYVYQIWFNGSGQALAGSSGFVAGGATAFGGGATSFGWAMKVN